MPKKSIAKESSPQRLLQLLGNAPSKSLRKLGKELLGPDVNNQSPLHKLIRRRTAGRRSEPQEIYQLDDRDAIGPSVRIR